MKYHYADSNEVDLTDQEDPRQSQVKEIQHKMQISESEVDDGLVESGNTGFQNLDTHIREENNEEENSYEEAISIGHLEQGFDLMEGRGGQLPFTEEMYDDLYMDPHYDNSQEYPKDEENQEEQIEEEPRNDFLSPNRISNIIDKISEAQTIEENRSSIGGDNESRTMQQGSIKDIQVE